MTADLNTEEIGTITVIANAIKYGLVSHTKNNRILYCQMQYNLYTE
ncbi:hypothetical protein GCM10027043_14410 [Ferruginibacter profundus]